MKRIFALLVALMLLALPALAETSGWLDYTEGALGDGSPVYNFPELTLTLPADWQGKVMALPEGDRLGFYQTASYERYLDEDIKGGGFLCALGVSKDGSFSRLPAFEFLGYSEASGMNYYLELPTDYAAYYEDSIRAEFDAMYAGVRDLPSRVEFHDGGAQPDAGTDIEAPVESSGQQGEAQASGISLERMRYHFEHSALPRYFYETPDIMLEVLEEQGVYQMWTVLADENGVSYPYTDGDFTEHWYDADDGTRILQIEMPAPEASPQCFRAYMVYNPNTGSAGYYTVEYENLLGETAILCGWTKAMEHVEYGGAAILDANDAGYAAALEDEAAGVAALAGVSGALSGGSSGQVGTPMPVVDGLAQIACPELGFTTMADPAYDWDYQEGTGVTIYTEHKGSIPYVTVWQSEDLLGEPFEFIREQYTPFIAQKYGSDLIYSQEIEAYAVGGKTLPAGVYTYSVQGTNVEMVRIYDSTGDRTVIYTAKYLQQGEAAPTLSALNNAVRYFRAD